MSYILEALKKAQAERQLGSAPTLHAPTLQSAAATTSAGRFGKPWMLVLAALVVLIALLAAMLLRPAAPSGASAPAVSAAPAQRLSAPVSGQVAAQVAAPVSASVSAPVPAPVAAPAAAPLAQALPAPVAALPPPVATVTPARAAAPAVAKSTQAGDFTKPGAATEEPVMNLRELPEPIQRSIPPVTVGGYIYSRNAADRLLLIDKVLRREGEEVAPGLILEKLQPKEAVFNFKGYRYRVPY